MIPSSFRAALCSALLALALFASGIPASQAGDLPAGNSSIPVPVPLTMGGCEATTAAGCRTNLGLGALATANTVDFSQVTGNIQPGQFPALTGDVTNSAGTVATTVGKIGGKPVTLGGAFSTTGAYTLGFTLSGNTALTLPQSGTLATTNDINTLVAAGIQALFPNSGLEGDILVICGGVICDSGMKPLKNYVGSVPPGANDDSTQGYHNGSIGTVGTVQYTLLDETAHAAVWAASNTLTISTYIGTTAPPLTADAPHGFSVGSHGVNRTSGQSYDAIDVTTNQAVWKLSGALANQRPSTWYLPRGMEHAINGAALTSTLMGLAPFVVDKTMTVSEIASRITTAGSSTYLDALYASDPTTGYPTGPNLAVSASIASTVAGDSFGVLVSPAQLLPGLYYNAVEVNDNTTIFAGPDTGLLAMTVGNASPFFLTGGIGSASANCLTTPSVYGTFPDLTGVTFTMKNNGSVCAVLMIYVASVP